PQNIDALQNAGVMVLLRCWKRRLSRTAVAHGFRGPSAGRVRDAGDRETRERPLLLDNVASIQQSAALALGRLANFNEQLAES
ncbi:unnamed protein product, partial [Durusdinium trenchii]